MESQPVKHPTTFLRSRAFLVCLGLLAGGLLTAGTALAQEAPEQVPPAALADTPVEPPIPVWWWIAPVTSIVALGFARKFYLEVRAADPGDESMIEIANHVTTGAMAYLRRQYKVVTIVFVVLALILGFMAYVLEVQNPIVPFAFLTGGFFSGLCGFLGMRTATMASNRTAAGARASLNKGLTVAFRAGAVMGLVVVGFALLDITVWFLALYWISNYNLATITVIMLTFGMGASTQALFARVGGGIYTKAADVGADLVGKVEAGIPEDDPRNPATIADNVGDNVGDVAGMGADLYESYAGSILATAALGVAAAVALFGADPGLWEGAAIKFLAAPMVLAGVGIVLSIAGIYLVQTKEGATMGQLMGALSKGVNGSSVMIAGGGLLVCWLLLGDIEPTPDGYVVPWFGIWGSMVSGLLAGIVIGKATEYYTSYEYAPTKRISEQGITGPATIIISGIAEGMKSTWASLATIIVAILLAFIFAGGGHEFMLGLYGVGFAAVGMLATLGITLATDAYGPIADNAGGNAEMTGQDPEVRERTDALDSLGNTTAATGKGFAIGSAALTALALLAAYIEEVRFGQIHQAVQVVQAHHADLAAIDLSVGTFQAQYEALGQGSKAIAAVRTQELQRAVYMGFGKFAASMGPLEALPADLKELANHHVTTYMLLNRHKLPRDVLDDLQATYRAGEPARLIMGPQATKEEGYVREAMYAIEIDGATRTYPLELVDARRATMAQFMYFYHVTLMNPKVLCGMFSGVLLAFLFCAMTMEAVGRAANSMMIECRRQFEKIRQALRNEGRDEVDVQNPDNWPNRVTVDGQQYPDYATCVAISTAGAQREMILPSLLAIAVPIFVGVVFGVPGVMGLLAGGLTSGFAVAIFMANAGGAWDNAKKLIETYGKITASDIVTNNPGIVEKLPAGIRGDLQARAQQAVNAGQGDTIIYGKGSDDHKASVVGDTVGDPFKDTSGPSLNILIKLMSMVSVVFAGLVVKYAPYVAELLQME